MSVRRMALVWEQSQHAGSNLLMLLAIADFADDDGRAYPAVASLAAKCRMKQRNANVILATLRQSGELAIRIGEGPRGTNLYHVLPLHSSAPLHPVAPLQRKVAPPAKECSKPLQRSADEPSVNHQGTTKRTPGARKTPIAESFQVSERVKAWATEKGFDRLSEHLEAFKAKCAAKGYAYVDHDAAFMEAIRQDWAKLRAARGPNRKPENFNDCNYGQGGRL